MKNKKFASFLAAAAALVLLAMPAFAADEQAELPAAEAAEVQQEQTAAPAEQETALPADAQTAGEPKQQLTYVALGDSITSGVGLADMKYNIAQIGYDLQPNFEGYHSQCYTARTVSFCSGGFLHLIFFLLLHLFMGFLLNISPAEKPYLK